MSQEPHLDRFQIYAEMIEHLWSAADMATAFRAHPSYRLLEERKVHQSRGHHLRRIAEHFFTNDELIQMLADEMARLAADGRVTAFFDVED